MTPRPDVFGLARAITEDAAQGDDYRDDCTCSRCEETRCLRATVMFQIATALLALEPLVLAAFQIEAINLTGHRCGSDKPCAPCDLYDAITTARAALGRETT